MNVLEQLQSKGVKFLAPSSCFVAEEVDPARIAPDLVVWPGCRLAGKELAVGPGCELGAEAPATVVDCQLGADVKLKGGFFERSTFLDGFEAGSGAHVRPGCLFEEGSSIAHTVGVKQTVFLPWVTAGSLINFCDILMAGGTSRKNHSEIGSSYIHFNYTPHQDKATASLVGDVPEGVLLSSAPIFLGGQGGLVGPSRLAYGTVIPAGQIWRGDVLEPNRLVAKLIPKRDIDIARNDLGFSGLTRIVRNNLEYIGNILALDAWYRVMRAGVMTAPHEAACHAGALRRLDEILGERMKRLDELAGKVAEASPDNDFVKAWAKLRPEIAAVIAARAQATVPSEVRKLAASLAGTKDYLKSVQSLGDIDREVLSLWLTWRVDEAVRYGKKSGCGSRG